MTDNGATLTVDADGFVHWGSLRLPVRYVGGALEFAVKHPGDRARLQCSRVLIPVDEFCALEESPAPAPCRPAGRMPREPKRRIVTRRNK
jgi:hypothetical protein